MKARVVVMLKSAVLDPQGRAVLGGLRSLGYTDVEDVRVGKEIVLTLAGVAPEEADRRVREMCEKLLANPVIEDYRYTLEPAD
ncbi:MAG TPA: phosphoribosylformylglycinamidine synthase subunit PurS [Candidatus Saccharimonadales bacterium]|nr:phosphoribosylformylglycinamidine synthase subunit PurS [Candidatus Saccharimonadales bacterium]